MIVPAPVMGIEAVVLPVLEDIEMSALKLVKKVQRWVGFGSSLSLGTRQEDWNSDSADLLGLQNQIPVYIPGITDDSIGRSCSCLGKNIMIYVILWR